MFCEKCGYQLPDDSDFCPACGTRNSRKGATGTIRDMINPAASQGGIQPGAPGPNPAPNAPNAGGPEKNSKKGLIIGLAIAAAGLLVVVVVALVLLLPKKSSAPVTTTASGGGSSSSYDPNGGMNGSFSGGGNSDLPDISTIDLTKTQEETEAPAEEDPVDYETQQTERNLETSDWYHDDFLGVWDDSYSQRCHMEIAHGRRPGEYRIDIWWGDSASTTYHWVYYGFWDYDVSALYVEGERYIETDQASSLDMENLYGYIGFNEQYHVIWIDYVDYSGEDCEFVQQNDPYDPSYYILPESGIRYYTKEELQGLTKDQLRIARNEILARYGRTFKDEELQAYFDSMPWYYPIYTPEEFDQIMNTLLNEYEKANIELIKSLEK